QGDEGVRKRIQKNWRRNTGFWRVKAARGEHDVGVATNGGTRRYPGGTSQCSKSKMDPTLYRSWARIAICISCFASHEIRMT
ncbi:MAG TPA: hypothetical protein VL424_06030, partial [Pararobbsia sp.]|nr:hypothetical protein [Pararobbsia sp.]